MELDEQSHDEPKQVLVDSIEKDKQKEINQSIEVVFDRFIQHTPNISTDEDPEPKESQVKERNEFQFEDRVCYTLRMQVYKQLRASIKLFRRAALLSDKVLPEYLYQ